MIQIKVRTLIIFTIIITSLLVWVPWYAHSYGKFLATIEIYNSTSPFLLNTKCPREFPLTNKKVS